VWSGRSCRTEVRRQLSPAMRAWSDQARPHQHANPRPQTRPRRRTGGGGSIIVADDVAHRISSVWGASCTSRHRRRGRPSAADRRDRAVGGRVARRDAVVPVVTSAEDACRHRAVKWTVKSGTGRRPTGQRSVPTIHGGGPDVLPVLRRRRVRTATTASQLPRDIRGTKPATGTSNPKGPACCPGVAP